MAEKVFNEAQGSTTLKRSVEVKGEFLGVESLAKGHEVFQAITYVKSDFQEIKETSAQVHPQEETTANTLEGFERLDGENVYEALVAMTPPQSSIRKLIEMRKNDLQEIIDSFPRATISSKENVLQDLYSKLVEERYDFLVQVDRPVPGESSQKRRFQIFTQRATTNIKKYQPDVTLSTLKASNRPKYESWMNARANLSSTVKGVGVCPVEEEMKLAQTNWQQARKYVSKLQLSLIKD